MKKLKKRVPLIQYCFLKKFSPNTLTNISSGPGVGIAWLAQPEPRNFLGAHAALQQELIKDKDRESKAVEYLPVASCSRQPLLGETQSTTPVAAHPIAKEFTHPILADERKNLRSLGRTPPSPANSRWLSLAKILGVLGVLYLLGISVGAWITGEAFLGISLAAAPYVFAGGLLLLAVVGIASYCLANRSHSEELSIARERLNPAKAAKPSAASISSVRLLQIRHPRSDVRPTPVATR